VGGMGQGFWCAPGRKKLQSADPLMLLLDFMCCEDLCLAQKMSEMGKVHRKSQKFTIICRVRACTVISFDTEAKVL
jgi:hypothetical protein